MVTDNSIANAIQIALNAQATSVSASYQFRIFADMGDYEANNKRTLTNPQKQSATPYVDGVLMLLPSNITPLTTIKSYGLSQMLTILAPTTREQGADGISGVLEVVKAWVENWAGQTGTLDDVAYVVAPQLPQRHRLLVCSDKRFSDVAIRRGWRFRKSNNYKREWHVGAHYRIGDNENESHRDEQ